MGIQNIEGCRGPSRCKRMGCTDDPNHAGPFQAIEYSAQDHVVVRPGRNPVTVKDPGSHTIKHMTREGLLHQAPCIWVS